MSKACCVRIQGYSAQVARLLLVALLELQHGLVQANAVHEVADAALGDDVGEGVADLDADHGGSGEASLAGLGATEHRDDEHHRVGAPREDGCPACPPDLVAHSLWLGVLGSLKADEEGVHDVAEWRHGQSPEQPASAGVSGDLTRVAVGNHESGGDANGYPGEITRVAVGNHESGGDA